MTPAQKVRLGAFLLVGLVLLGGSLVVLAGLRIFDRRAIYKTRFTDSVAGLEVSAQVRYRGLRVGRVEDMHIAADDPTAIEVVLGLDPRAVLYEGTHAQLDTSGLTGLKTINLTGGDPRAGVITPGSTLPSDLGTMDRIVDHAESVAAKVNQVATQLAAWASDDNRKRVERILVSLDGFLRSADLFMAESRVPLTEAVQEVGKASTQVAELSREGASTLRMVRDDLSASLKAVRRPLEKVEPQALADTVHALRAVMMQLETRLSDREAGQTIQGMNVTMAQLNRLISDLDLALRASREDFTASMSYLRQATEDLREFSRLIAQDPSVLVRGRGVGE